MIEPFATIFVVFGNVLSDFRDWALDNSLWAGLLIIAMAWLLRDIFGVLVTKVSDAFSYLFAGAAEWCRDRCRSWSESADSEEENLRSEHKKTVIAAAASSLLIVALVGLLCTFNYQLLIRPLDDMLGEDYGYIGAAGIIVAEFITGSAVLVLLARSNLLPLRREGEGPNYPFAALIFAIFLGLCAVEIFAAIWRDVLIQREIASQLGGQGALQGHDDTLRWMPTTMQAILGVAVPWVLMMASLSVEEILRVISHLLRRVGAVVAKALAIVFDWIFRIGGIAISICIIIYAIMIIIAEVPAMVVWFIAEKIQAGFLPARVDLWTWVRNFQSMAQVVPTSRPRPREVDRAA